jgi:hypothetical protein
LEETGTACAQGRADQAHALGFTPRPQIRAREHTELQLNRQSRDLECTDIDSIPVEECKAGGLDQDSCLTKVSPVDSEKCVDHRAGTHGSEDVVRSRIHQIRYVKE